MSSRNWVRFALARPFVDEPGGAMLYPTGNTHLLSAMLTRASGRDTHALMRDWLAEPLGITIPPWSRDPQGIFFGGNDMMISPPSLARFDELYRLGGVIDGRRIVPARWIEESWTPRTVSPWSGGQYGYGWFVGTSRGHPLRFAWGYGGQMPFIVPDLKLTVVMTSDPSGARDNGHIAALHALLDDGIVANNGETLGHIAAAGVGITRVGRFSVAAEIADGRLVPLLEDYNPGYVELIHAVFVGGSATPARVRVFVDFLVKRLASRFQ